MNPVNQIKNTSTNTDANETTSPIVRLVSFVFLCVFSLWGLTACIDQEVALYVNPDGSGKIVLIQREAEGSMANMLAGAEGMFRQQGVLPASGMQGIQAAALIQGCAGVEAWTDFRAEKDASGKNSITLRGYFPDINKLKVAGFRDVAEAEKGKSNPD